MRSKLFPTCLAALLLLGFVTDGVAQSKGGGKAKLTAGLRYPCLTADGKQIVFCYRGDIWIASADGKGQALRLTLHEDQDTLPRVSPDGKTIAFSSHRNGNYDIFLLPVTGGVPKQITFHSGYEIICGWSPDGKKILFVSPRQIGMSGADIYEVGIDGGTPRRITVDGGREGAYSPDGTKVVYTRGANSIYWDDYEGSANYDLYVIDAKGGAARRLTETDGNERYPFFTADGKTIYFIAEEKGVANFYAMPVEGGKRRQVTKFKNSDVHRPDLNWDRKTAVFERVGRLYTADLEQPADKPTPIPLSIQSDVRNSGIEKRTITSGGEQVDISKDGLSAAVTVRGDIWIMPSSGGEARRITSGPANDQWPKFSPDGARLAYFSNIRGNSDIYVLDLRTGAKKQVTSHPADDFFQSWAPDGRSLVFTSDRTGNKDIWLVDLETGIKTQLTRNPMGEDDPVFSPDGRTIAFDSGREGTQAIYIMNADGSEKRRVTQEAGFFQVPTFSPDGEMLVFEGYSPTTGRSTGLFVIRTSGGRSARVSQDGSAACWSPTGDYVYFAAERGSQKGIFRVKAPTGVEIGEHVPFVGTVEVDLRKELANLFDEAWTALKDGFYDPKMHGVDWNAIKVEYRNMAIDAECKAEFQNIMRQVLAELGASHLGISGGSRTGVSVQPKPTENGLLGLGFVYEPVEGGGRCIESIVPGGPADRAGLRVRDVVTRIGSTRLKARTNLDKITVGMVGKDVPITFRPHSEGGLGLERTTTIKPASLMGIYRLQQKNRVDTCARRVKEASKKANEQKTMKGEVGYIHLSQMDPMNLQKFQQTVARWNSRKKVRGMILDVRNNGGGNIHGQLMAILMSKPLARVQRRGGPKVDQPSLYWNRPVVLLINERSFSDAEVFPHMFREGDIGKIVGMPTAGGVIGTNDITLSDGSTFRVPRTGFWTMEGKNLEGMGVKPDILVKESAEDRISGRDPQLSRAVEVILAEIKTIDDAAAAAKKKPAPKPKPKPVVEPKPAPKPLTKAIPAPKPLTKPIVVPIPAPKPLPKPVPAPKPLPKPVVAAPKPAPKPLPKPVVVAPKPAPKPKPEPEPEPKPEPEPEPKPEPEPEVPDHPIHDAQVGEWVKLRQIAPGGNELFLLMKVTDVTDEEVVLAQTMMVRDKEIQGPERRRERKEKLTLREGLDLVSYGKETVTIDEKDLECIVVTATDAQGVEWVYFVCHDVPVDGTVRILRAGEIFIELVEWGTDSD